MLIWDTLTIALIFFLFSLPQISSSYEQTILPTLLPILLPLTQMTLVGSVYTTLAVAVERYMAICQPYRSDYRVHAGFVTMSQV